MSKNVMLSDEAYAALFRQKKENESFSDLIKRLAPPQIRTLGDLEKHLENMEGPLFTDMKMLRKLRARKLRANAL